MEVMNKVQGMWDARHAALPDWLGMVHLMQGEFGPVTLLPVGVVLYYCLVIDGDLNARMLSDIRVC